jgi:hypothetical protein
MCIGARLMERRGVFISHAHEDHELAESVRRLLEAALGLDAADITCTSDPDYGLKRGDDLRDAIRHRLDSAKALFLLATPAARDKDWVNFECGHADAARASGEMAFYILAPTSSLDACVPAPYRRDVAVTLSDGSDVHAFVGQLRKTLPAGNPAVTTDYIAALLNLERRCARLEHEQANSERAKELESMRSNLNRLTALSNWKLAAACLIGLVLAALGSWWTSSRFTSYYDTLMEKNRTIYQAEIEKSKDEHSKDLVEATTRFDQQLKDLPFSGVVQDGQFKPLPCTAVEALVPDGKNREPRRVPQTCNRGGTFTFSGQELQADPRDPITLVVRVGRASHRLPIHRSEERLAIPILGVGSGGGQ